jgi:hypothetical protein
LCAFPKLVTNEVEKSGIAPPLSPPSKRRSPTDDHAAAVGSRDPKRIHPAIETFASIKTRAERESAHAWADRLLAGERSAPVRVFPAPRPARMSQ